MSYQAFLKILALLTIAGCGSEGDDARQGRDGGANGIDGPGQGDGSMGNDGSIPDTIEAGPGQPDGGKRDGAVTPGVEPACLEGQVRCRGACFDQVGQVKNGCELVLAYSDLLQLAEVAMPGMLFATAQVNGTLVRIDTADFRVKVLEENHRVDTVYGTDGDRLYYGQGYRVRRVPIGGGTSEQVLALTSSEVDQALVFGDHLYFTSNRGGLLRVPLAGGTQEQVITAGFDYVALDADYIYTHDDFEGVQRRTWQAPNDYELLIPSASGAVGKLFLFASQPKQVFADALKANKDLLLSVPSAGGAVETVYDLGYAMNSTLRSTGTHLAYSFQGRGAENADQEGLDLLRPDGKKRTNVDSDDRTGTLAEDATYVYLAREKSLFRIAKSAL